MRGHRRWASLAALAVALSACSGIKDFGITVDEGGDLEVLSSCTDRGISRVDVRRHSPDSADDPAVTPGPGELLAGFEHREGDPPMRVVFDGELTGVDPDEELEIFVDYADPTLIGQTVELRLADLRAGFVAVSTSDTSDPTYETRPRAAFEDARSACSLDLGTKTLIRVAALLAVVAAVVGGAVAIRRHRAAGAPDVP